MSDVDFDWNLTLGISSAFAQTGEDLCLMVGISLDFFRAILAFPNGTVFGVQALIANLEDVAVGNEATDEKTPRPQVPFSPIKVQCVYAVRMPYGPVHIPA